MPESNSEHEVFVRQMREIDQAYMKRQLTQWIVEQDNEHRTAAAREIAEFLGD